MVKLLGSVRGCAQSIFPQISHPGNVGLEVLQSLRLKKVYTNLTIEASSFAILKHPEFQQYVLSSSREA